MKKKSNGSGIRKSTFQIGLIIAFGAGFLSGMVWMAYRSAEIPGGGAPHQHAAAPEDIAPMIEAAKKMAENQPDRPEGWIQLGNLYFDHDRANDAIDAYEKALSLDPENADVWTDLGVMFRRSGQPRKAVAAFDRAVSENPAHTLARFNKGIVLMHDLEDGEAALAAWEELLTVDPLFTAPNGQPLEDIINHYRNHES